MAHETEFLSHIRHSYFCGFLKAKEMNQLVNKHTKMPSEVSTWLQEKFCVLQVMIQKHNRHMSFSLYISVLAVADTVALLIGNIINYNIYCENKSNFNESIKTLKPTFFGIAHEFLFEKNPRPVIYHLFLNFLMSVAKMRKSHKGHKNHKIILFQIRSVFHRNHKIGLQSRA